MLWAERGNAHSSVKKKDTLVGGFWRHAVAHKKTLSFFVFPEPLLLLHVTDGAYSVSSVRDNED